MKNDARRTPIDVVLLDDAAARAPHRDMLLARLGAITVAPGQDRFVISAAQIVALADADPARHLLVVTHHDEVAAVGVLHPGGALSEILTLLDGAAADDVVLFRGFLVDQEHQGQGIGTAVSAALPALADRLAQRLGHPGYALVVLNVDQENAAARRAYVRAGFIDRGHYLDDDGATQRVMALAIA